MESGGFEYTYNLIDTVVFSDSILKYNDAVFIVVVKERGSCSNWWFMKTNRTIEEALERTYKIEYDLDYIRNCNPENTFIFNLSDIIKKYS